MMENNIKNCLFKSEFLNLWVLDLTHSISIAMIVTRICSLLIFNNTSTVNLNDHNNYFFKNNCGGDRIIVLL